MLYRLRFVLMLALCLGPLIVRAADPFPRKALVELGKLAKSADFSGVVLIAKDGKPVFEQAYGLANRADNVANRSNTRFNMASMGKMVTAVAVMQLVESGRIALDGTVGKYLPQYPDAVVREQVTIQQLLTHTSGLGSFWAQLAERPKERYDAVADYLPLFGELPLESPPGERFSYSNTGYTVLGLIIEAASGQSYFDYVRKYIYEPAGMVDTDAFRLDAVVPRMAAGYARHPERPGEMMNNVYMNTYRGGPAGGSYSTAPDLLKFARAVMQNRLLSAVTTAQMTTGKVDYGKRRYGYGFSVDSINGHRLVGHSGGHIGIADELLIFPDLGYTVVILTNGDVENFWAVQNFIKREIAGVTKDTQSYDFTQSVIDAVAKRGYQAGAALLAQDGHAALRTGMLQQHGDKLLWQNKVRAALDLFTLYTKQKPEEADAWLGLGTAHERNGAGLEAIAFYQQYLKLSPADNEVKARLAALEAKHSRDKK